MFCYNISEKFDNLNEIFKILGCKLCPHFIIFQNFSFKSNIRIIFIWPIFHVQVKGFDEKMMKSLLVFIKISLKKISKFT